MIMQAYHFPTSFSTLPLYLGLLGGNTYNGILLSLHPFSKQGPDIGKLK